MVVFLESCSFEKLVKWVKCFGMYILQTFKLNNNMDIGQCTESFSIVLHNIKKCSDNIFICNSKGYFMLMGW